MKKEVVGINHLNVVVSLLEKCNRLLIHGEDIHPFSIWIDRINETKDEVLQYIEDEKSLRIDLERYNED